LLVGLEWSHEYSKLCRGKLGYKKTPPKRQGLILLKDVLHFVTLEVVTLHIRWALVA
jgi:hypothetical protein